MSWMLWSGDAKSSSQRDPPALKFLKLLTIVRVQQRHYAYQPELNIVRKFTG
jgi:hypothetical protein